MPNTPSSQTIWNAVLTVVGGSFLAIMGMLWRDLDDLDDKFTEHTAKDFTAEDGELLRTDVTAEMTEIDKNISILENDSRWMEKWLTAESPKPASKVEEEAEETHPVPSPSPIVPDSDRKPLKYDLRSKSRE